MSRTDIETRLREAWDDTPAPPAPLAHVHRRVRRARRRAAAVGGAVVVTGAVAALAVALSPQLGPHGAGPATTSTTRTQRLGAGSLMVTVPADWAVTHTPCSVPDRSFVRVDDGELYSCPQPSTPQPTHPTISLGAATDPRRLLASGSAEDIGGLHVLVSDIRCDSGLCSQVVTAVGDDPAGATFTVPARDRAGLDRLVHSTVSRLPSGLAVVPNLRPGPESLSDAVRDLEARGLRPDVEPPGGSTVIAIGYDPEPGRVVDRSSVVRVVEERTPRPVPHSTPNCSPRASLSGLAPAVRHRLRHGCG